MGFDKARIKVNHDLGVKGQEKVTRCQNVQKVKTKSNFKGYISKVKGEMSKVKFQRPGQRSIFQNAPLSLNLIHCI